jgi:hypothetical protein
MSDDFTPISAEDLRAGTEQVLEKSAGYSEEEKVKRWLKGFKKGAEGLFRFAVLCGESSLVVPLPLQPPLLPNGYRNLRVLRYKERPFLEIMKELLPRCRFEWADVEDKLYLEIFW